MSLDERVTKLASAAVRFRKEVYRSAAPRYANTSDLLTGEGARRFGGRWNPAGVTAFYGSLTPQCALEETLAHARYYGLPINTSMPRTFVAIEVQISHVLDLTDGSIRRSLQISERRLLDCDWRADLTAGHIPITQRVGELAASSGFEAILVRSSADASGTNLVVFVDNLRSNSRLEIVAPDKLSP